MSTFHGQTRPDAPRIAQDLSTKGYFDTRNVVSYGYFNTASVAFNEIRFFPVSGTVGANTTENLRTFTICLPLFVEKAAVRIRAFTLDDIAKISLRTVQADTVPDFFFTVTGQGRFFVDDIHPTLAEVTDADWEINTTLAGSGSLIIASLELCGNRL